MLIVDLKCMVLVAKYIGFIMYLKYRDSPMFRVHYILYILETGVPLKVIQLNKKAGFKQAGFLIYQ